MAEIRKQNSWKLVKHTNPVLTNSRLKKKERFRAQILSRGGLTSASAGTHRRKLPQEKGTTLNKCAVAVREDFSTNDGEKRRQPVHVSSMTRRDKVPGKTFM